MQAARLAASAALFAAGQAVCSRSSRAVVDPGPTVQLVRSVAALQDVRPVSSQKDVRTSHPAEDVLAGATQQLIVPSEAGDEIPPGATRRSVHTPAAGNLVVTRPPRNRLTPPLDDITSWPSPATTM